MVVALLQYESPWYDGYLCVAVFSRLEDVERARKDI